ncbi:PLP-dependent aminotransferase family protein [Chloroflexota bacterium]
MKEKGSKALQYGTTEGYSPLREVIAGNIARYGIEVEPENILITSGSQQALDFLGRLFINRGDRILVESPTYLGALQAWNAYGAEYVSVPLDDNGMKTDELEKALRSGVKFIYVLPNFQNPTGATLSLERRNTLIKLADQYGVPIVEDDPYGKLRYEGKHIRTILDLDSEYHTHNGVNYSGNVIYLSTFSKLLAPGLRLGWVVAPQEVIMQLVKAKQAADLHTATLNQFVAHEIVKTGFVDRHVRIIRKTYKERRDMMLETMTEYFPEEVRWTHPKGGMFLWGILPKNLDAAEILKAAIERKVAFVPGFAFHATGGGNHTMRLNFSYCDPATIREGILRLGTVLKEEIVKK